MSREDIIWAGTPSHVTKLGTYVLCALFFWLVIPIFIALWTWLVIKNTRYEITTQRLRLRTGVINRKTSELELYRVKDFSLEQPLLLRLFSLANLVLVTSDRSHPQVVIRAVPHAEELTNTIRQKVEELRRSLGVREVDM
jgi:uncharacterized membrane protein YdbT with pleckstrin-like domain